MQHAQNAVGLDSRVAPCYRRKMKALCLSCLVLGIAPALLAADPKPITVTVDQEFKITLPYNPSTGYQWQLAKPVDESLLKVASSVYKRPESKRIGAGGDQVWTFKAVGTGSIQVALQYLRPWEKGTPPARTTNFVVVISQGAAGLKPVTVTAGQQFKITLPSNPSTGYEWQLAKPVDENLLKLITSEYEEPDSGRVGAGGKQVWAFKAVGTGSVQIQLHYLRPWEKGTPPASMTNFTVVIEKKTADK
jgi:inhibitor of cysteine peptidase